MCGSQICEWRCLQTRCIDKRKLSGQKLPKLQKTSLLLSRARRQMRFEGGESSFAKIGKTGRSKCLLCSGEFHRERALYKASNPGGSTKNPSGHCEGRAHFRPSGCGASGAGQPNELCLLDTPALRKKLGNILRILVSENCGG